MRSQRFGEGSGARRPLGVFESGAGHARRPSLAEPRVHPDAGEPAEGTHVSLGALAVVGVGTGERSCHCFSRSLTIARTS